MQINLNDLEFKDGRYVYTFTPNQDMESIDLQSDCFGDLLIDHMQVERNPDATYFVPPEVYEGKRGGIFKYLDNIKLELTDTSNSELWAKIRISAQGMLNEYHNGPFSSALSQQSDRITKFLEDKESIARQVLTAKGFQSFVIDKDKKVNSEIIQLKDLINSKVSVGGLETIFQQSGDTIWQAIQDKLDGNKIIASINMTKGVTKISNDLIQLDGDTVMNNAFARKLLVDTLEANDVTAFVGKYANLIAQNLDVNNLSGNLAKLGQAIFDGRNSRVRIDPTGMQVMANDGNYSTKFNQNGIDIWRTGTHVGSVKSLDAVDTTGPYVGMKSMSLTTQPDSYLSLSYYSLGDNTHYRALSLGGDGRLRVWSPFNIEDSNRGWKMISTSWPKFGSSSRQSGTAFKDTYTNRYFGISDDGDFWMPMTDGYYTSASNIIDKIRNLQSDVSYIKSELKYISNQSKNWSGGGYTPSPEPSKPTPPKTNPTYDSNIQVGDRVKLKSSATYYYNNDDQAVRIPTYSNSGQPIKDATFTVARIRPWSHQVNGYYELYIGQWQIAWARKDDVYKV